MSDRATIDQVLAGDVAAFARLVDHHYDRCARVALRILGNREDAEEVIQDAFLRAFRALASYEDRERFSAWLTRILVNQCRTMLARTHRRESVFDAVDLTNFAQFAKNRAAPAHRTRGQIPVRPFERIIQDPVVSLQFR